MELRKAFKQTEVGVIPDDWEVVTVGEITHFINGTAHEKYINNLGQYVVVNSKFISTGGIIEKYCTELLNPSTRGDVLMVMSDVPNGRAIAKCFLVEDDFKYTVNQRICILRSIDVNSKFFYYQIDRNKYYLSFDDGVKQTNLRKEDVLNCPIPLPPTKAEQTAIATALSDMDKLIAGLEQLIAKKKAIKQGAMQELLRPKEGWVVKKLGDSADIFRGGSPRPIERFLTNDPDGINWIKIGDVGKFAKYIESTEEKIIPEGISRSRFVNEGDFLLSNSMSFGRPYILKTNGCIHDGWLVIQNYTNHFDRGFLYYVLGSESILVQYRAMASGSSVLNLNKEIVKNVLVNCPESLEEQSEIATILSDMDDEIILLEKNLEKSKMLKQGMMQELLTGKTRLV